MNPNRSTNTCISFITMWEILICFVTLCSTTVVVQSTRDVVPSLGTKDFGLISRDVDNGRRLDNDGGEPTTCLLPPGVLFNRVARIDEYNFEVEGSLCEACREGSAASIRTILHSAGLCFTAKMEHFHRITQTMYVASSASSRQMVGVNCGLTDPLTDTCPVEISVGTLAPISCLHDFVFIKTVVASNLSSEIAVSASEVGEKFEVKTKSGIPLTNFLELVKLDEPTYSNINRLVPNATCLEQSVRFAVCDNTTTLDCSDAITDGGLEVSCPSVRFASDLDDIPVFNGRRDRRLRTKEHTPFSTNKENDVVQASNRELLGGLIVKFVVTVIGEELLLFTMGLVLDGLRRKGKNTNVPKGQCPGGHYRFVYNDGVGMNMCFKDTNCRSSNVNRGGASSSNSERALKKGWLIFLVIVGVLLCLVISIWLCDCDICDGYD